MKDIVGILALFLLGLIQTFMTAVVMAIVIPFVAVKMFMDYLARKKAEIDQENNDI